MGLFSRLLLVLAAVCFGTVCFPGEMLALWGPLAAADLMRAWGISATALCVNGWLASVRRSELCGGVFLLHSVVSISWDLAMFLQYGRPIALLAIVVNVCVAGLCYGLSPVADPSAWEEAL